LITGKRLVIPTGPKWFPFIYFAEKSLCGSNSFWPFFCKAVKVWVWEKASSHQKQGSSGGGALVVENFSNFVYKNNAF